MSDLVGIASGTEVGGYLVEELIGRGGMGEVYRAHDNRLGRNVALKILASSLAADEGFRERMLRESRLAASLDHPNVVPIYEAGDDDGHLFIAMRFVDGEDFRSLLRHQAPLDPARVVAIAAQVADALDAAHDKGLVHRDVKPSNVLLDQQGGREHVYLADFGLTQSASDRGPTDGHMLGTVDYVAPEQIRGDDLDGRADVYSLGCLLFEALTGTLPFEGASDLAVVFAHLEHEPPRASERAPMLPTAVDDVIARAMAKDREARQPSCRELVEEVRTALGLEAPPARRRRLAVAMAAAAVLVAVAAIVSAVLLRGGTPVSAAGGGALVRIDPRSNSAGRPFAVGAGPETVAADANQVWASSRRDASLWRLVPATGSLSKIPAIGVPGDLARFGSRVYVAAEGPTAFSGNVAAYDAVSGNRLAGKELLACSVTAGAEGVWVAGCPDVYQLDEASLKKVRRIVIPFGAPHDTAHDRQELEDMTTGAGSVWVLGDAIDRRLWRIDPATGRIVHSYRLGFAPQHVEVAAGSIWLVDQFADEVVRIDPDSGRELARIQVGRVASGLAFGDGSIWTGSNVDRTVERIDPRTNRVVATIRVREQPRDLAFGGGAVWVLGDAE